MNDPDPYRTPTDVSVTAKRGFMKSPLVWIVVGAAVGAAFLVVGFSRESVVEFGENRAGPPIEFTDDVEEYEREMLAAEPVEDSGE